MAHDYDNAYKDIFSYPEMVRDLLLQFTGGDWLKQVDFATLERVNASYVSDRGDARHDDMVWKVRLAGEWMYVYVLLEFQSQVERWMALRMLVYIGLLYQDLVKLGELSPQNKLPPVLPVVLYSGARRWTAPTALTELLLPAPQGLEQWQPAQQYLLIDETAVDINALNVQSNLVAALFKLEQSRTAEDFRQLMMSFNKWLGAPEQASLRRSVARWILRMLRRRLPEDSIPKIVDLSEINDMSILERSIDRWAEEFEQQGRLQLLRRLLVRRFGPLPAWVENKLGQANETQLLQWGENLLDAPTLSQLFAHNR